MTPDTTPRTDVSAAAVDLMAALRASLDRANQAREAHAQKFGESSQAEVAAVARSLDA